MVANPGKQMLGSPNRTFQKHVYTSRFSTGKPNPCNGHIYHFPASESLNLILFQFEGGDKGGEGVIISYILIQGVNGPTPFQYWILGFLVFSFSNTSTG
jgi:hypothetical protein